tara:strand:- start:357 stop:863 length:507 start_codon:yes stop_codon:yes gene_type:complete
MGFDIYGMNPKIHKEQERYSVYNKYKDMDFKQKWEELDADEDLRNQYWREHEDYEENNPGIYFRNNVWWWRPLWRYVCEQFPDILNERDEEAGGYNDGHAISESKAIKIGIGLTAKLESGEVEEYAKSFEQEREGLDDDDWNKHYPFNVENVEQFAKFCLDCGGFEIC